MDQVHKDSSAVLNATAICFFKSTERGQESTYPDDPEATQKRRANYTSRNSYHSYARRYSTKEMSIATLRTSTYPGQ